MSAYKINVEFSYVFASNFKMTIQNLHLFPPLHNKYRKEGARCWPFHCSSPGCCYLIFHFICSQPSVYCMQNFIPLVSTSSAIKAGHNDLLGACKVSSPADPKRIIYFLTTGSCIPGWKEPQISGIYSPHILASSIWNTIIADNFQPLKKGKLLN